MVGNFTLLTSMKKGWMKSLEANQDTLMEWDKICIIFHLTYFHL